MIDLTDITVLIPFKNGSREDWLEQAIGSIPKNMQYIVCRNDGELAEALNAGLKEASTEWIVRLDADDFFYDNCVEELKNFCLDADVVYPELMLVDENLQLLGYFTADPFCPNRFLINNMVAGAGTLFRRQLALNIGGYRDMESHEDYDLWFRMFQNGARFKACPEAKYVYRQVSNSRNKLDDLVVESLKNSIVGERPHVTSTFYIQETNAQNYWRCSLPAKHIGGQVIRTPKVVNTDEWFDFPYHRGTAVWAFPGHEHERWWMAAMQEQGIPVVVETDDNYLMRIPHGKAWAFKSSDNPLLPSVERHRHIVKWVDGVITTTDHLANQYRKFTDAPVFVCPNQIEPNDWIRTFDFDELEWYDPNKTYVGWTASASHLADAKLVVEGLEWCSKQKNTEVVVFGVRPKDFKFPYRSAPWTNDLALYRQVQSVIDIGVAPIVENPWSSCRSDLKALEYAMSDACPVLSSVIPYKDWTDGQGCRKASNAKDFTRVLRELVNNPGETKRLAADAKQYVLAERTMKQNAYRWQQAIAPDVRKVY